MDEKTIQSVNEFIDLVDKRKSIMLKSVFRGQGDKKWKLIPSFYRINLDVYDNSEEEVIPNYTFVEKTMLDQFHQRGISLLKHYEIKNKLDLMVVAQHHGLPTRLLDWTENPLYALYFAIENLSLESDACVYKYVPTIFEDYINITQNSNFNHKDKYWFISPQHINERVKAQNGFFTLHPLSKKIEVDSFDELLVRDGCIKYLEKVVIPRDKKHEIKQQLDKLDINRFTIYPDLDGLASKIKTDIVNLPFYADGLKLIIKND